MTDLVRREERRPVRRAELRAFLLHAGPQSVDTLLAYAKHVDPHTDRQWLEEQLETRTSLFEALPDGRYRGRPDEPQIVVTRRAPRPRPRPRPKPATPRWSPPEHPEPEGRSIDLDEDQALRRVEIGRPEGWTETGRRITVSLPPDGAAPLEVLRSIEAAARASAQVEVFTAADEGTLVFRGSRAVISTRIDTDDGRTEVTFGPAVDDIGLAYTRATRMLGAGSSTPTALTPFDPNVGKVQLSPAAQQVARLPVPSKRSTGSFLLELEPRLARLAARTLSWEELVEWLVPYSRTLGRQDFEHLLRRLCADPAVPHGSLLSLLVDDLHVDEVADEQCARALLIMASENPHPQARFADWALDNHADLALQAGTAPTRLIVARLSVQAARPQQASELFDRCASELSTSFTTTDLSDWISCAFAEGELDHASAAFEFARHRAMESPAQAADERDVLVHGVQTAQDYQLPWHPMLMGTLEAFLVLPELEAEAIEVLEAYGDDASPTELLELLSLFETASRVDTIEWLIARHLRRVNVIWHELTPRAQRAELERLQLVERIIGRSGLTGSFVVEDGASPSQVPDAADALEALQGLVIVMVGGHRTTFDHVRDQLARFRPTSVDHVEPSWESNRTARSLKPKLEHADLVIEATSQMKHQDSDVIAAALGKAGRHRRIRAAGGPSRIVHHLSRALERR